MKTAATHIRSGLRLLSDMVFPPVCAGCGIHVAVHDAFCTSCWVSIPFIERPFCNILGRPLARDFGEGFLCAEAIASPPVFDSLRSAVLYNGSARSLVRRLKYQDATHIAPLMAAWMLRASDGMLADCDCIVPVPLHWTRLVMRRFNQSAELGRHLAARTHKRLLPATLIRMRRTSRQVGLTVQGREKNVRGAFSIAPGHEADVAGKRVVLVDDVYTTGATVSAATRVLKKAGAARVDVLTFAMALDAPVS